MRSGAGATVARTGPADSLRTPTRMLCASKCVTRASTSWPAQASPATTASAHGAHIPGRRLRATPPNAAAGAGLAKVVPSCGCVTRILARSRYSMMATSPDGRLSATGTPRSTRRPCIAARCSWIGHRAALTSSIRLTVAATTSVWLSISDLTSGRNSKSLARSWIGPPHPHPAPRAWNWRRGCGGASTGMRPIPSSAGTPQALVGAFLLLRSWAAVASCQGCPLSLGSSSLTSASRVNPPFPGKPYHGPHPPPCRRGRGRSKRRTDEPAGTGPAEVRAGCAAAQAPCGHRGGPGHRWWRCLRRAQAADAHEYRAGRAPGTGERAAGKQQHHHHRRNRYLYDNPRDCRG